MVSRSISSRCRLVKGTSAVGSEVIVIAQAKEVALELREWPVPVILPCSRGKGEDFLVPVFGGMQVQHEVDQCPFQARARAAVHRESGASHAGGALEVQDASDSRVPSGAWAKRQRGRLPQRLISWLADGPCRSGRTDAGCGILRVRASAVRRVAQASSRT